MAIMLYPPIACQVFFLKLTNYTPIWYIFSMQKKVLKYFMPVLVLIFLFTGTSISFQTFDAGLSSSVHFENTCDMCCCSSENPACLLCMTSNSNGLYLPKKTDLYLPMLPNSLILIDINTLPDQGFVKTIYHPPTFFL